MQIATPDKITPSETIPFSEADELKSTPSSSTLTSLDQIESMDQYLQTFGTALGRKAIDALAPLHVPGRDSLPAFDDLAREPFEPQKHVIAAAVKMLDEAGSGFLVGTMGCIAGESEVYDPVDGISRRVDQITEPFHVIAYDQKTGTAVVGTADVPFIKGRRALYHVKLQFGGESFSATGHHRILVRKNNDGQKEEWITVDEATQRKARGETVSCREVRVVPEAKCAAMAWNPIDSITFLREDDFYDFSVDVYHNYVMAGVVHHNTGKTLLGMTSIHKHAQRSRRKGGRNGKYRAIVLCPDHLIAKWAREVEETIPGVIVHRFDNWKGVVRLIDNGHRGRWSKPRGAEYYIVGRNQAKWFPDWLGTSDSYRGFGGRQVTTSLSSRTIVVERAPILDDDDNPVTDAKGNVQLQTVTDRVFSCLRCGTVARDRKGLTLSAGDISKRKVHCEAKYLQMIAAPEARDQHGKDRICPIPDRFAEKPIGQEVSYEGHRYVVRLCGEPFWWFTSKPYRWAPARIIQKKLRRFFHYLVIDECHEHKSDESGQSMAAGKLIASVQHTIALTGTIIGGYADHLFPLLMRISPETLRSEGFVWGKDLAFSEAYGRIDRIITIKEEGNSTSVGKSVRSMRRARTGKLSERKVVRPGVMPTLFGRHMIGSSLFITLDEMADELPNLYEYIGGPFSGSQDDPFWVDTCCEMESSQRTEYHRIESILNTACKDLLQKNSMKLLGAMLWTTIGWPDFCYASWGRDDELTKAVDTAKTAGMTVPTQAEHSVGYWDKPGSKKIDNWVGVVTPKALDASVIYPKEQVLIDICNRHNAAGHQVLVYAQMTQKRNVTLRLKNLLERHGLRVGVMRSGDVDPKERKEWIAKHGRDFDVLICHPKLVSTGLDLFSKAEGGHNYNCIVFYQTGYNLFDMRQASRRSWRIGQPRDCYVYYLYYKGSMQHRAMSLMSRKMAAAHALEGEFSEEGLAAMAGEDNLQMALAKSLAAKIDDSDMQRSWSKVNSNDEKKPAAKSMEVSSLPQSAHAPFDVPRLSVYDPSHSDSADKFVMPELTEDILARMFANLLEHGQVSL